MTTARALVGAGVAALAAVAVAAAGVMLSRGEPALHRNVRPLPLGVATLTVDDTRFSSQGLVLSAEQPAVVLVRDMSSHAHRIASTLPVSEVAYLTGTGSTNRARSGATFGVAAAAQGDTMISVTPAARGTYHITCDPQGDGMDLTVTVR